MSRILKITLVGLIPLYLCLIIALPTQAKSPQCASAKDLKTQAKQSQVKASPAKAAAPKENSYVGMIVDKMCADNFSGGKPAIDFAAKHDKACSLNDGCSKSGYMLLNNGHWIMLDASGCAMAKKAIAASKKNKGAVFKVEGNMNSDILFVSKITEND